MKQSCILCGTSSCNLSDICHACNNRLRFVSGPDAPGIQDYCYYTRRHAKNNHNIIMIYIRGEWCDVMDLRTRKHHIKPEPIELPPKDRIGALEWE